MTILKNHSRQTDNSSLLEPGAGKILFWAVLHYLAYIFMQTLALFAETRRGPALPDLIHEWIVPNRHFDWMNSILWLPLLLFFILLLALRRRSACVNYLRIGAVVSLARGIFIVLTSLGPPHAVKSSAPGLMLSLTAHDISFPLLLRQWFPLDVFYGGSGLSAAYLTQDLFFSGHTATTFLLLLVVKKKDPFFALFLIYHVVTVCGLIFTHEHYSIDILGAYFIVYAIRSFLKSREWLIPDPPRDPHRG